MAGKDQILAGSLKTKLQGAVSKALPATANAEQHRKLSEPGSGNTKCTIWPASCTKTQQYIVLDIA